MQVHVHYPSISAIVALGRPEGVNAWMWDDLQASKADSSNISWFGVSGGRTEVKQIVATGWQAGVKRVFEALGRMSLATATDVKRRRCRGSEGDELDIHRVWCGKFDQAWSRTHRAQTTAPKHMQVIMQIGALANVDSESMFWRGAACVAIVDALEEAGYSVEILGYSRAAGVYDNDESVITFPIKAYEQPLSISDVASTCCLAGFHRHYIFGARLQHRTRRCSSGYGSTRVGVPDELIQDGDTPIHISLQQVGSEAACKAFVAATLKPYQ
jgi:hypothetical protein